MDASFLQIKVTHTWMHENSNECSVCSVKNSDGIFVYFKHYAFPVVLKSVLFISNQRRIAVLHSSLCYCMLIYLPNKFSNPWSMSHLFELISAIL